MKKKRNMILIVLLCILSLCACIPSDYSKNESDEQTEKGIEIAEDYLKDHFTTATIKRNTFRPIDTSHWGDTAQHMSDWVQGKYLNGGEYQIMVNIHTGEIYTSDEWITFCRYAEKPVYELYGLDEGNAIIEISGRIKVPACADDDSFGDIRISNMLPADAEPDDEYIEEMYESEDYHIFIRMIVNDEVDMNIFENTDLSVLGHGIELYVEQYPKELVDRYYTPGSEGILDKETPIATYESDEIE